MVDTKEETPRCLEILPAAMDRHAASPAIYYSACLAIAAQFGPGCMWSKDVARSICTSLANGIALHEEKNRKAHDVGKDLLETIIGEQSARILIGQRKEQLQLSVGKKGRASKKKTKNGKKKNSRGANKQILGTGRVGGDKITSTHIDIASISAILGL